MYFEDTKGINYQYYCKEELDPWLEVSVQQVCALSLNPWIQVSVMPVGAIEKRSPIKLRVWDSIIHLYIMCTTLCQSLSTCVKVCNMHQQTDTLRHEQILLSQALAQGHHSAIRQDTSQPVIGMGTTYCTISQRLDPQALRQKLPTPCAHYYSHLDLTGRSSIIAFHFSNIT